MHYRTLYLEKKAQGLPLAQSVLQQHDGSPVVSIHHHKDVFNRPGQCQRLQKAKPALILAASKEGLIYPGPRLCQTFSHDRFFYAAFLQNCLFDCSYCFLQGLYPGSDILAFLDIASLRQEILKLAQQGPCYLALSHDSDLMALHRDLPYLDHLETLWPKVPHLVAEVRTKSANAALFQQRTPQPNLIFAFSLAPQAIIDQYERKTPSLKARLHAAATAMAAGHPVRLCFDPIFCDPALQQSYRQFFWQVFDALNAQKIQDVSYGFFRLPKSLLRNLRRQHPHAHFFALPLNLHEDPVTFPKNMRQACEREHIQILSDHYPAEKIFFPDMAKPEQ